MERSSTEDDDAFTKCLRMRIAR